MIIRRLADAPEHAQAAATMVRGQGWANNTLDTDDLARRLLAQAGPGVACTFVAEMDGACVGTASLDLHDLPGREDLSPWLANVVVSDTLRGQGIGAALVRQVEAEARSAGIAELWLYTRRARPLYLRLGWRDAFATVAGGKDVYVMHRALTDAP